MMQDQSYLAEMQQYVAKVAITPSALRNLRAEGLVRKAQNFLGALELGKLGAMDSETYPGWLECQTEKLKKEFGTGDLWGPARKCINIFMVMASLNRFLCSAYALEHLEDVFEVPLDNLAANGLRDWAKGKGEQLKWTSIKELRPEISEKFQGVASEMAREKGIPRGHLDVLLWKEGLGN